MLYVLLRFTDSDYPFGIFRLFLIVSYQDMMADFYIVVGVTTLCRRNSYYFIYYILITVTLGITNNDITIDPGIK